MLGKDKRIAHLEEKVSDLKEARSKRAEAVSTLLTQTTSFIKREQKGVGFGCTCKLLRLIDKPTCSLNVRTSRTLGKEQQQIKYLIAHNEWGMYHVVEFFSCFFFRTGL